ncbi:putative prenylated rab acceptor P [Helianthus annuus]|nr:putative prenylated rab acceptor P [Helianthus annuus]KAJ0567628.1 putative prenylated rab acceptor P [Helianthus annuus]KAJ0916082.1 putative prenylated rab acceptor P [Helianthus annuus]
MQTHAISSNPTMSSQPPAVLPVSTTKTTPSEDSQPPVATPAVRAFINHISNTVRSGLSDRRPWSELVDRTTFSKPESITDATTRIRKNYSYFRVNYFTVVAIVIGISLLTNPVSLVTLLVLLSAWIFLYLFRPTDPPLVILGRAFSERETLGLLVVLSIVVIFLTSVGYILMSATLVGTGIVCAHGAFRAPEDLFLDEQEPGGGSSGFLSLLGGAASNAAASAVPVIAPTTRG